MGRNRILILIALVLATLTAQSQGIRLSSSAKIYVITCGPSQEEVFLAFGHSAIRIHDQPRGIDYAYNYGVFDFNQPNFYINYTKGLLLFKLGVYQYADFVNAYAHDNRWVTLQELDLSEAQKQSVFDYLEWNAMPENQTYRYDYFYNNCSSKVRDVFKEVLGDSIQFDGSHITTHHTIRQLTDLYLKQQPWGDLGIDICLGLPMDKKAEPYEYMFLPDFLEAGFDHASIKRNGDRVPIVKNKEEVWVSRPEKTPPSVIHPWIAFGAFLVITLGLSVRDLRKKELTRWFDVMLFGLTGSVGLLLVLLWTATDHDAAANNFNLLWALPTHLAIFAIYNQNSAPLLKKYFLGVTTLTLFLLLCWFIVPQQLHIFLIPFVAALLCRAFVISRLL